MGVHGTTGAATLFIYVAVLFVTAAYIAFVRSVGRNPDQPGLLRAGAWYAVDISMVLNAMLRGKGVTDFMRIQQCVPPMTTMKEVFAYLDQWYGNHYFGECILILVFDGRRCPAKRRNAERALKVRSSRMLMCVSASVCGVCTRTKSKLF